MKIINHANIRCKDESGTCRGATLSHFLKKFFEEKQGGFAVTKNVNNIFSHNFIKDYYSLVFCQFV